MDYARSGVQQLATTVDVLDAGETVMAGIPVEGGSVVRDRNAAQHGRLSLDLPANELAPLDPGSALGPAGYELRVNRGFTYPDGTTELVPVGVFAIQDSTVDGLDLTTHIEAVDRSQRVADARLENDAHPTAGVDLTVTAASFVQQVIPDIVVVSESPSEATPAGVIYPAQTDRWEIVQNIATDIGYEIYFDGVGNLILRSEPDLTTESPVWVVDEGPTGVLVSVSLAWSRRPSYNKAIVTGTNTEFGVTYTGSAVDDSPSSPSYYSGRFGPKPYFHFSPTVASDAAAANAARAILRRVQGVAMSLDFSAIPMPALEPGDVVVVRRAALDLDLPVIIDSISLDLGVSNAMTCEVRARQEEDIT